MSTKSQRAKARAKLIQKYWGNAVMVDGALHGRTFTFAEYQLARREAWEHGMKIGFQAGLSLGKSEVTK